MRTTILLVVCVTPLLWGLDADARPTRPRTSDTARAVDGSAERPNKALKKKAKRTKRAARSKPKPQQQVVEAGDDIEIIDDESTTDVQGSADVPSREPTAAPADTAVAETGDAAEVRAEVPPKRRTKSNSRSIYFRAGVLQQQSRVGATDMQLPASLPIAPEAMAGSGVAMKETYTPLAMIVGYALPVLDRRLALETILGFPIKMQFRATGPLADESLAPTFAGIPTGIEPLGPELGEAKFAPPVVTAVYRLPDVGPFTALVGVGGMVLYAYDEKITNPVLNEAGQPTLSIAPAAGLIVQGGLEIRLWRRLAARVDVKYVAGMTVEARVDNISVLPKALPIGPIDVGTAVITAELAPLIFQAGIGADF